MRGSDANTQQISRLPTGLLELVLLSSSRVLGWHSSIFTGCRAVDA